MPGWFRDQVVRMSEPDLPDFDPEAALGDVSGGHRTGGSSRGRRGRRSTGSSGVKQSSAEQRKNHPLSDVWGDG